MDRDTDLVVWVESEEDYGIVIKMEDSLVWVKLRNTDEVAVLSHKQIEVLTEEEIDELEDSE